MATARSELQLRQLPFEEGVSLTRVSRLVTYLFQRLRVRAPCVLFFDELDAIFAQPSPNDHVSRAVISGIKRSWKDLINEESKIFVYGATHQPWLLAEDTDLARLFENKVFFGLPTQQNILGMLKTFFAEIPNALTTTDLDWISGRLLGGSHSDVISFLQTIIQDQALLSLDADNWMEVSCSFPELMSRTC